MNDTARIIVKALGIVMVCVGIHLGLALWSGLLLFGAGLCLMFLI